MKKIYILFTLIAGATLLAGCQKDIEQWFTAEIENYQSDEGKVYIENKYACWHDGDKVRINSDEGVIDLDPTTNTAIVRGVTFKEEVVYNALYPSAYAQNIGEYTDFVLPSTQTYREQTKTNGVAMQVVEAPMVAMTANNANLSFKNIGSLLKIEATNQNKIISRIEVTATDPSGRKNPALWGEVMFDWFGDCPQVWNVWNDDANKNKITLFVDAEYGQFTGTKDFYIFIPPLDKAAANLEVVIYSHDVPTEGTTTHYYKQTKQSSTPVMIERNQIGTALAITLGDTYVSLEGDGSQGSPYTVHNDIELEYALAKTLYATDNRYISLAQDITMLQPNNVMAMLNGHLDGNNHTITVGTQAQPSTVGLLQSVKANSSIKNLNVNAYIVNSDQNATVGGLVNSINDAPGVTIENCIVSGTIMCAKSNNGTSKVGGLIGYWGMNSGENVIRNCKNQTVIDGGNNIGGIVGDLNCTGGSITVERCANKAKINGYRNCKMGGIIGNLHFSPGTGNISECVNEGVLENTISTTMHDACNIGGIIGMIDENNYNQKVDLNMNKCINKGNINGGYYVGGIIGKQNQSWTMLHMVNCVNHANINSNGQCVGGLMGVHNWDGSIRNCYSDGNITGGCDDIATGMPIGGNGLVGRCGRIKYDQIDGDRIENVYVGGTIASNGKWILNPESEDTHIDVLHLYRPADNNPDNDAAENGYGWQNNKVTTYDSSTWTVTGSDPAQSLVEVMNANRGENRNWDVWKMIEGKPRLTFEETLNL